MLIFVNGRFLGRIKSKFRSVYDFTYMLYKILNSNKKYDKICYRLTVAILVLCPYGKCDFKY